VAPTKTITRAPSLRDRNKNQTARTLRAAALKLFATQGYDATTTEEIAEKAGVSARTFFRYFPTKESLLFFGEHDWIQSYAEELPRQPKELSDLDALCATITSHTPRLIRRRQSLLLFVRAVASSRTLRGLDHDHQQQNTRLLAQAIATRRGQRNPDEACTLLAAVTLLAYRRALDIWLAGPASTDPAKVITKEFKLLSQQLTS
jgi:AcrR family transcriptional regulator